MTNWQQIISNPIVILILAMALVCYSVLLHLLLSKKQSADWSMTTANWLNSLPTLLTALPLLGLLGTIVGLLKTFRQMSLGSMDIQALLSSGIADAMLTTELGLLMVIPGWLMLSVLKRKWHKTGLMQCAQG